MQCNIAIDATCHSHKNQQLALKLVVSFNITHLICCVFEAAIVRLVTLYYGLHGSRLFFTVSAIWPMQNRSNSRTVKLICILVFPQSNRLSMGNIVDQNKTGLSKITTKSQNFQKILDKM